MTSKMSRTMSLKQFMLRQEVLTLYRDIFRAIRKIPGEDSQIELRDWVRNDFKKNKHQTDENAIKVLIQHGKTFLGELQRSISMSS